MFEERKQVKAERIAQQEADQRAAQPAVLLQEAHLAHEAWRASKIAGPFRASPAVLKRGVVAFHMGVITEGDLLVAEDSTIAGSSAIPMRDA